jgi:hypothetical protein
MQQHFHQVHNNGNFYKKNCKQYLNNQLTRYQACLEVGGGHVQHLLSNMQYVTHTHTDEEM